jgi:hypothetical protein
MGYQVFCRRNSALHRRTAAENLTSPNSAANGMDTRRNGFHQRGFDRFLVRRYPEDIMSDFDPYRKWLGIPPHEQPPSYYRLLGLSPFESDRDVIANAADRQMAHLRTFQGGKNSAISQQLLNEVSAARICLMDPKKRAEYDARLRTEIELRGLRTPLVAETPAIAAPPDVDATPSVPVAPYHYVRRKKTRWQGPLVTLIATGVALLAAVWFIYSAVEEKLSERKTTEKRTPEKQTKTNPPRLKANPPATKPPPKNPPAKNVRPNTTELPVDGAQDNARAGKSLCFVNGNWGEGLPKLADSTDEDLKKLAQKELAAPEAVADRLAVADGWWALSEKFGPPAKAQIRRHAVEWYQKVVGELEDSDRDRAEWRISQETPIPRGEKPPVNPDELE